MTLINSLNPNEEFTGYYLLRELSIKQTNGTPPKDYFDIIISDTTGQLSAKYWDVKASDKEEFFPMSVVKINGLVQTYRDKLQVKIIKMHQANDEDGVSLSDFIRIAPIHPIDLLNAIKLVVDSIGDQDIRSIVTYCVGKVEEKLMHYPAAKTHHHAYCAGLAYHIVRMLEIGEFICKQRPFLKPDLIKAGIILHDIAKPEEMEAQFGVVTDYTVKGKLIGHISLACNWVTEGAIKCGIDTQSERVMALHHLVLSHHNLGEWGSPIQPQLPEAVALHHIDALDAKLQMVEDALDTISTTDKWTPNIRGLENKSIYRFEL